MNDIQKLERLAFLANLPYCDHTSEDWDEELKLECELQDHPKYIFLLNPSEKIKLNFMPTANIKFVNYYKRLEDLLIILFGLGLPIQKVQN